MFITNPLELRLIQDHRRKQKAFNELKRKQKTCSHKYEDGSDAFFYDGHGHNDDAYKCQLCGFIDWG